MPWCPVLSTRHSNFTTLVSANTNGIPFVLLPHRQWEQLANGISSRNRIKMYCARLVVAFSLERKERRNWFVDGRVKCEGCAHARGNTLYRPHIILSYGELLSLLPPLLLLLMVVVVFLASLRLSSSHLGFTKLC